MPIPEDAISAQQERLYESSSLRDDLNDEEATMLLNWAEMQVARLARDFPDEFEQKCRFLRQLVKGINRFIGQREFNDLEGQREYLNKFVKYLEPLGFDANEETLLKRLPEDKADMRGGLKAVLAELAPSQTGSAPPEGNSDAADTTYYPNTAVTEALPGVDDIMAYTPHDSREPDTPLENPNPHSINQSDSDQSTGDDTAHEHPE